jgi:hypothetical protein
MRRTGACASTFLLSDIALPRYGLNCVALNLQQIPSGIKDGVNASG